MRSLKVLVLAVLVPGALSAALYDALRDDGPDHYEVRVRSSVEVAEEEIRREIDGVVGQSVDVAGCEHARQETATLDAQGLSRIRVVAGSGTLDVRGLDDADAVVVRSTACASAGELLRDLRTEVDARGSAARVETHHPRRGMFGRGYARIDLVIEVPRGMAAEIEDGSGEMRVAGTGETRISDGSGEIEVRDLTGALTIRDGSGEIEIRGVDGEVELVDGSGEIRVVDVTGSVRLTDGSGSVDVTAVGGDVEVRADGSGSIDVTDVGGDFTVRADGSGGITHSGVAGDVRVPRKR